MPGPDGPGREVREAARRGRLGSGRDRGPLRRPPPPDRRRPRPGQAGPRRRAEPAQRRRVRGQGTPGQGGRGQRRAGQPARAPEQHSQAPAGPAGVDVPGTAARPGGTAVRRGADRGAPGGGGLGGRGRTAAARFRAVRARPRSALRRGLRLDRHPPPEGAGGVLPGSRPGPGRADPVGHLVAWRAGREAGDQGPPVRPLAGARAGQAGRLRVRRDHRRVPAHSQGGHQSRAVQGGPWPAREGRPAPHR